MFVWGGGGDFILASGNILIFANFRKHVLHPGIESPHVSNKLLLISLISLKFINYKVFKNKLPLEFEKIYPLFQKFNHFMHVYVIICIRPLYLLKLTCANIWIFQSYQYIQQKKKDSQESFFMITIQ